jgi:hypothetical protein
MEVRLVDGASFPTHPYWKVAVAGDRAEVAEIACDDERTESLVFHADLEARLREKYPDLAGGGFFSAETPFLAGWLTTDGDEAFLRLQVTAGALGDDNAPLIGHALSEWCRPRGIRRLKIADASQRSRSPAARDDDWSLE